MKEPKEKAKSLVDKHERIIDRRVNFKLKGNINTVYKSLAIQCALICVDEIIESSPSLPLQSDAGNYVDDILENRVYWQSVKEHIKQL